MVGKRKLALILCSALIGCSLIGCSNGSGSKSTSVSSNKSEIKKNWGNSINTA